VMADLCLAAKRVPLVTGYLTVRCSLRRFHDGPHLFGASWL
jgi:hypothetical protein